MVEVIKYWMDFSRGLIWWWASDFLLPVVISGVVALCVIFLALLIKTFKKIPWNFLKVLASSFFKSIFISWKDFPGIWKKQFYKKLPKKRNVDFDPGPLFDPGEYLSRYG